MVKEREKKKKMTECNKDLEVSRVTPKAMEKRQKSFNGRLAGLLSWSEQNSCMKVILLIWTTMIVSSKAAWASRPEDTVLCPLNEYIDDNDETVREFFECPGRENPPDHTICCEEKCCPMIQLDSVLKVDIRIAMIISLTVIVVCILAGIILVLCCFMSSCPKYDTCAGSWGKDEPRNPPSFFNGYVPGEMPHPMATLNGGRLLEKNHKVAVDIGPIKVTEADHV